MAEEELTGEAESEANETECTPAENKIEELTKALAQEKQTAETYLVNWQRAQADFINYKRRSEQEKQEVTELAHASLILNILPVLDDLERAFNLLPADLAKADWATGFSLIARKLKSTLEAQGLTPIKAIGEVFDPRLHEAIKEGKGKEGLVIEEAQTGYKFRDKVIRPSKVVVGNGEKAERR